jgi:UDP-glucose 4-epimerase
LAECSTAVGQVFNIGAINEISILELAREVIQTLDELKVRPSALDNEDSLIRFVPYEQAYQTDFEDMRRRVPDTSKIQRLIGWQPSYTLERPSKTLLQTTLVKTFYKIG